MINSKVRTILFSFVMLIMFFTPSFKVEAATYTGYTVYDNVPFTNIANPPAGTQYYVAPGILHTLDTGDVFTFNDGLPNSIVASTLSKCMSSYYLVSFYFSKNNTTYSGYVCGDYISIQYSDVEAVRNNPYVQTLRDNGFAEAYASYWPYLLRLHNAHPNWNFVPLNAGDWATAVAEESTIGSSLIQSSNKGLYSVESDQYYNPHTDTFVAAEGTDWFIANSQAVAFHLDPRNYLNEISIFMFEFLQYGAHQDAETLRYVFGCPSSGSYLCDYIDLFVSTGSTPTLIDGVNYTISPVSMASRVNLETGLYNTDTVNLTANNGLTFSYGSYSNSGIYNLFNIGAYADSVTSSPRRRGLAVAAGYLPIAGSYDSYNRPWNTYEKSITGGIDFVKQRYISNLQDTLYYQKFNVRVGSPSLYHNQYMTNISAPNSEALSTYKAYKKSSSFTSDTAITFYIPVFAGIPSTTSFPPFGSQNNYLNTLTVNGEAIAGFNKFVAEYTVPVSTAATNVVVGGTAVSSKATIQGAGSISLSSDTQTVTVTVKAENGTTRNYYLNVIKTDDVLVTPEEVVGNMSVRSNGVFMSGFTLGSSSKVIDAKAKGVSLTAAARVYDASGREKGDVPLVTGDKVLITNNSMTKEYKIVIYGDTNGDGSISILDLLRIQKHIMNYTILSSEYFVAADSNRDGKIDILDLLQTQKHILGKLQIEQ